MPTIPLQFNQGVQAPASVGTVILKPAGDHRLSYAQNVDAHSNEYGDGVVVPGPALITLTNNSDFTGVPWIRQFFGLTSSNVGHLYVAEGLLGATNKLRRIKDVEPGETPSVDTADSLTVSHSAHSSVVIEDMAYRVNSVNDNTILILGKDATDAWLQKITPSSGTFSGTLTNIYSIAGSTGGLNYHRLLVASNNVAYIGFRNRVDSVAVNDSTTVASVLTLPSTYAITEMAEWNTFGLIAYQANVGLLTSFDQRKSGGSSGIIIWDFTTTTTYERNIPCPARFISAIVISPSGNCYVFGGVNEGKTTIYEFTGYALNPVFSYIGDMPRSRHSVDFDGEGRLNWITADGQWLRLDLRNSKNVTFDHLNTITTGSSAGGMFVRAVGGSGNEFILASGSGSTYASKRAVFGSYTNDSVSSPDTTATPLVISETVAVPPYSMLNWVQIDLQKPLAAEEKVEVRLYKNGNTTYSVLGSMDYNIDGAKTGKKIYLRKYNLTNFNIGVAWKQTDTDTLTVSPGILAAALDYSPLR